MSMKKYIPKKVKIGSNLKIEFEEWNDAIEEYETNKKTFKEAPRKSFHGAIYDLTRQLVQALGFPTDPLDAGWSRYQPTEVAFDGYKISAKLNIHEDMHNDPIKVDTPTSNEVNPNVVDDALDEIRKYLNGHRKQGDLFADQPAYEEHANAGESESEGTPEALEDNNVNKEATLTPA